MIETNTSLSNFNTPHKLAISVEPGPRAGGEEGDRVGMLSKNSPEIVSGMGVFIQCRGREGYVVAVPATRLGTTNGTESNLF